MKTFVKENWYKLMVGSSMLMASFGFMMYAISPAYSNSDNEKTSLKEQPNNQIFRCVGTSNAIYWSYDDDVPTSASDWNKITLK